MCESVRRKLGHTNTYVRNVCSAKRCGLVQCRAVIPFPLNYSAIDQVLKLKKMRCCWLKGSSRSQLINVRNATVVRPSYDGCRRVSTHRMYVAPAHAVGSRRTACMKPNQLKPTTRCSSSVFVSFLQPKYDQHFMPPSGMHPCHCRLLLLDRLQLLPKQIHVLVYISRLAL